MEGIYYDGFSVHLREDYPLPQRKTDESLIRILVAGICNTDKEILRGYRPDFNGILGHEFVGIVDESDDKSLIGKRVTADINSGCGDCVYCNTGREKHCLNRLVIGIDKKDGCFATYIAVKNRMLHIVPEQLSDEQAVYTEPLAAAVEIASQIHIKPETNIAVIGDGRLSMMITQVLALSGADITVIGRHEDKLKQFEPYAKTTKSPQDSYEVVVDACGNSSGLKLAMDIVRKQGQIVLKSTYAGEVSLDMSLIAVNEITITGSRCGPFEPAIRLLEKGYVNLPDITLYSLKDYGEAFNSRAFKVGFDLR